MCGRFTLRNTKKIKEDFGTEIKPHFNVSPGQNILTVTKKIEMMRWYFNPTWAKKPMNLINARSETLHEKPSFRDAGRCVIPVESTEFYPVSDFVNSPVNNSEICIENLN